MAVLFQKTKVYLVFNYASYFFPLFYVLTDMNFVWGFLNMAGIRDKNWNKIWSSFGADTYAL